MSNVRSKGEAFHGIQYLRGVAALMVVVHHARHYYGAVLTWSYFGSAGVDIFFIISGFIMVHATRNFDPASNRIHQAFDFFVRRAIRIIPLYWLALLFLNRHVLRNGTADTSLTYDFLFIPRFNPSHGGEIFPSLIVGWTLNFEMFFYIIFGFSIIFGKGKYLVSVLTLLALVAAGQLWGFQHSAVLRVWTGNILGEFALGMGIYLIVSQNHWTPRPVVAAGVFALSFVWLAFPNGAVPRLLADGVPSALIVWSGLHLGRMIRPMKVLTLLGDASYSIYLTHVFALPHCYKALNRLQLSEPTAANIIVVLTLCTVASAIVGVIVYYLVEKPLLRAMTALWQNRGRLIQRPIGA